MYPLVVDFLFDFVSPNAYLSHKVLPGISTRTGAVFRYVPIYLAGLFELSGNRPPRDALVAVPNKRAYREIERARFIRKHDLADFRPNPHFIVESLDLMRVSLVAQDAGCFEQLVDAAFAGMWERQRNLGDADELFACLASAGLDAASLLAEGRDPAIGERLRANTAQAHARGAFGTPTFFVKDEMYFGKDRLAELEEQIVSLQTVVEGG